MMEKIEWYQEVLEIEPSSKVFFPLAKLLAGNQQPREAIAVLRQGLDRHPEFFEARLLLIDLLQQDGDSTDALREAHELSAKLVAYPGFWDAWAGSASARGADKDLTVALRLLAALLRNSQLSWTEIIEKGLAALAPSTAAPSLADSSAGEADAELETIAAAVLENAETAVVKKDKPKVAAEPAPVETQSAPASTPDSVPEEQPKADTAADDDEGEDEPFTLRTKTMATVLAEQGDYAGAIEIYEEILAATTEADARVNLQERIAELNGKIKSGHTASAPDSGENQDKNKLIQVLERLAGRLENRADD